MPDFDAKQLPFIWAVKTIREQHPMAEQFGRRVWRGRPKKFEWPCCVLAQATAIVDRPIDTEIGVLMEMDVKWITGPDADVETVIPYYNAAHPLINNATWVPVYDPEQPTTQIGWIESCVRVGWLPEYSEVFNNKLHLHYGATYRIQAQLLG